MDRDVAEFLESSFSSVWSLELVLALYRQPERLWDSDELIGELRSSHLVVQQGIKELLASGLIVVEAGEKVRYGPASDAQHELLQRLEEAYRVKPTVVRRLIVQSPAEKLRIFSDAFKIVKD